MIDPRNPDATFTIDESRSVPTAVVRGKDLPMADLSAVYDSAFGALFPALAEQGIAPAGAALGVYTRFSDDWSRCDLEVGVPLHEPLPGTITVAVPGGPRHRNRPLRAALRESRVDAVHRPLRRARGCVEVLHRRPGRRGPHGRDALLGGLPHRPGRGRRSRRAADGPQHRSRVIGGTGKRRDGSGPPTGGAVRVPRRPAPGRPPHPGNAYPHRYDDTSWTAKVGIPVSPITRTTSARGRTLSSSATPPT